MKRIVYICTSIQTFICFKLKFLIMRNYFGPEPQDDPTLPPNTGK
jgi:hypothetical protein